MSEARFRERGSLNFHSTLHFPGGIAMTQWLVTSTFYGQWLPGDEHGSVTNVRDRRTGEPESPKRREHARPGDEYESAIPGLQRAAMEQMKGPVVSLDLPKAEELLDQLQETARHAAGYSTPYRSCPTICTLSWRRRRPSIKISFYGTLRAMGLGD